VASGAGWQVAIVGGGPAGLSVALHLRALAPALRVVVLERATYPRDKYCAGAIGGRALPILRALGLEPGRELPALPIDRFVVEIAGGVVDVREPAAAVVVRRSELDHALALAAKARGVEVLEGARVTSIARTSSGMRVHYEGGAAGAGTLEAEVLVGADGVTGVVRRALGLPRASLVAQAIEVDTERVPNDLGHDTLRFVFDPALRGYRWDFPTPVGGRVMMSRGVYQLRDQRQPGDDVRAQLEAHLAGRGLRLADHAIKQLAEHGLDPRAPLSAPRVILVGEAAGIDFPTGEGIAQALGYGAIAAPYLIAGLRQDRLGFLDWRTTLLASAEGRFLHRRWRGGRMLFSAARPRLERALLHSPRVFQLALGRFAGRTIGRGEAARAGLELAAAFARS